MAQTHITLDLDEDLFAAASEMTGITDPEALVREALTRLIRVEAGWRSEPLSGRPMEKP